MSYNFAESEAKHRIEDTRGRTTTANKVVEKIASQAAFEVYSVGSAAGGVLGIGSRRDFDTRPTAEIEIYGNSVVIRLDLGLRFPVDLRLALQQVRHNVTIRVAQLTGLEVARIDVTVSWLYPSTNHQRELS